MRSLRARSSIVTCAILVAACTESTSPPSATDPSLRFAKTPAATSIFQLASPPGTSNAHDITSAGVIAGSAPGGCDGYTVPVIWVAGALRYLPLPSGLCRGRAIRINESGSILGNLYPAGATSLVQSIPVYWTPTGSDYVVQELGTSPDGRPYDVLDFNEQSHAIANITIRKAFWWSESTGFLRLQDAPGSTGCYANGLNDLDQIVGQCEFNDNTGRHNASTAFWSSPTAIPEILPRVPGYSYVNDGADLNNVGIVIGKAWDNRKSGLVIDGVEWIQSGSAWSIVVMPSLGAGQTYPEDINDDGWVTGSSNLSGSKTHGFLWKSGQPIKDLGALNSQSFANALTPSGSAQLIVVGRSTSTGSVDRAVFWKP
jgi:probable HAF family extracellular repeat protein